MPNDRYTFPNQRTIKIHREEVKSDFLGIKNENWMAASRHLGATALRLYLYLAANKNNYELALSPAAIERDLGMARSTYHDQFRRLVNEGYLINTHGNTFEFFEVPQPRGADNNEKTAGVVDVKEDTTASGQRQTAYVQANTPTIIETNNSVNEKNNKGINIESILPPTEQGYDWGNTKEFIF